MHLIITFSVTLFHKESPSRSFIEFLGELIMSVEKSKQDNVVACGIDNNYVWPLLVMLTSAHRNSRVRFRILICYDDRYLDSNMRYLIAKYLEHVQIKYEFVEIYVEIKATYATYLTPTTYTRLYLADQSSDIFLWLDADIMCRKGWDQLFDFKPGPEFGAIAAGVRDPLVDKFNNQEYSRNSAVQKAKENYINTGVLSIDSKAWRKYLTEEDWKSVAEKGLSLGFQFQDQCVLNYVLWGKIRFISAEFNYLIRNEDGRKISNPKIAHFSGWEKPWHFSNFELWFRSPKEHRDLYREYSRLQVLTSFRALFTFRFEFFGFYSYVRGLKKKSKRKSKITRIGVFIFFLLRKIKNKANTFLRAFSNRILK